MKQNIFIIICIIFHFHVLKTQEWHDGIKDSTNIYNKYLTERKTATDDYIDLYQHWVSGIRGSECAMYPSCSNYAKRVFKEKSFPIAFALTADRLLRCGHDNKYYDLTAQYGKIKILDYPPYLNNPEKLKLKDATYYQTDNLRPSTQKDSIIAFVHELINQHDYDAAILEIKRLRFYYPPLNKSLYLNLLKCYEALQREEDAIYDYEVRCPKSLKQDDDIKYMISWLYYKLNNTNESTRLLSEIDTDALNPDINRKSALLKTYIALKNQKDSLTIKYLHIANKYIESNANRQLNLKLMSEYVNSSKKSPAVARILSIVPGLGYVYTNQLQNAIVSLMINGLFGYAVATSIHTKNYGMASLMGVFSLSFYFGNILGAGNSAKKYNLTKRENLIKHLYQNNSN